MRGYTAAELRLGQKAEFRRRITEDTVNLFASLSGDRNPLHLDEDYAKTTRFAGRIAHGMIAAGFISAAMVETIPGPGAVYLSQTLEFLRPIAIGETLTVELEILTKDEAKNRLRLKTVCRASDGQVAVSGEASVMPTRQPLFL
ncbi:MAG: MaoC family dehydratase [Peptococcaceae bacterium]|jgi:3-hydroxybutyryl-CoA dehydratase|nr:MaoC family dehydratase [Peptococcaceae bacterium]